MHKHCEKIACGILAKYVKHRSLQQRPELQQGELDDEAILTVDQLLDEVALVIQHAVNYDRFSLAKAQDAISSVKAAKKRMLGATSARAVIGGSNSSLSKLVVLLSRSYAELEILFARNSMEKAVRVPPRNISASLPRHSMTTFVSRARPPARPLVRSCLGSYR